MIFLSWPWTIWTPSTVAATAVSFSGQEFQACKVQAQCAKCWKQQPQEWLCHDWYSKSTSPEAQLGLSWCAREAYRPTSFMSCWVGICTVASSFGWGTYILKLLYVYRRDSNIDVRTVYTSMSLLMESLFRITIYIYIYAVYLHIYSQTHTHTHASIYAQYSLYCLH